MNALRNNAERVVNLIEFDEEEKLWDKRRRKRNIAARVGDRETEKRNRDLLH